MEKLDFQSIHIGDILMGEAGDGQRGEAGITIVAFAFCGFFVESFAGLLRRLRRRFPEVTPQVPDTTLVLHPG
ncbi:MAG: hypothetical protein D6775_09340 [Caldilineae bacterium]|nr:MAG: hypothetical protein D6775_09340 [Caldilineae bacterium]